MKMTEKATAILVPIAMPCVCRFVVELEWIFVLESAALSLPKIE